MHTRSYVAWAPWAMPGVGPEFRFTPALRRGLAHLAHRLRVRLTNEHLKGGRSC